MRSGTHAGLLQAAASFICRWVALAGCSTQVRASATWVAIWASFRSSMNRLGRRAAPLATPKDTTPQDAVGHVLLPPAHSLGVARQARDSRTQATFGWACQVLGHLRGRSQQCRAMRRCRRLQPQVDAGRRSCGDWMEPRSRMSWARRLGDVGALQAEAARYTPRRGSSHRACVSPGNLSAWAFQLKRPAIHDDASDGSAVAVHVLGGGVGHNVGAPLDGPAAAPAWGRCCPR